MCIRDRFEVGGSNSSGGGSNSSGGGSGGAGVIISPTEPADKTEGMIWLNSDTAEVFIFDGAVWLEFPAGSGGGGESLWTDEGSNTISYSGTVLMSQPDAGTQALAVGVNAGATSQGELATALGRYCGETNQGIGAAAVGSNAGRISQGTYSVSVGYSAGKEGQGQALSLIHI